MSTGRVVATEAIAESVGRLEVMLREQRTDSTKGEAGGSGFCEQVSASSSILFAPKKVVLSCQEGEISDCSVVRSTEGLTHLGSP